MQIQKNKSHFATQNLARSKGMRIAKANDITLRAAIGYGGIKIQLTPSTQDLNKIIRIITCATYNFETDTKGYKSSSRKKPNELNNHYNLKCSFCPKSFVDLGSLNKHIR